MRALSKSVLTLVLCLLSAMLPAKLMAGAETLGIVIMHGKGGSPSTHVAALAKGLEAKGYLVANLEMPWSGKRDYDVSVGAAEDEVGAAVASLRSKGAHKVFVAGHSQGGVFALHLAAKQDVDGIICIAPGGNVASQLFRDKLGDAVKRAKRLIAEGKGHEKAKLADFEGNKGIYPVITTPVVYLSWFDPEGAMNSKRAARAANPHTPILWLVARDDYPGLRKANIPLFDALPKNPYTRFYEPDADHRGAPAASMDEIVRWTAEVARSGR